MAAFWLLLQAGTLAVQPKKNYPTKRRGNEQLKAQEQRLHQSGLWP
jgi:hypothetical protein